MLWAEITSNHKRILVGVCHRSPSQSSIQIDHFISSLEDSLSVATTGSNSSVFLLGDFNDRCTHWLSDHKDSQLGLKLVNLVDTFNMHQLIDTPTRNNNLLDLILCMVHLIFHIQREIILRGKCGYLTKETMNF